MSGAGRDRSILSEVGSIMNHQLGKGIDMTEETSGATSQHGPILMRPGAGVTKEQFSVAVLQGLGLPVPQDLLDAVRAQEEESAQGEPPETKDE